MHWKGKKSLSMDNNILIITGGYIDEGFLKTLVVEEEYLAIIVADLGLVAADNLKLRIDYILGDFDSVHPKLLSKYKESTTIVKTFPSKKDKTDTELALELALEKNPTKIDIVGATGTRMDHTMANIDILAMAMDKNVDASIIDRNNRIYIKNNSFRIKKEKQYGDYISLLPYTHEIKELTLKGFKYPLDSVTLTRGKSLGISNEIVGDEGIIEFDQGVLVVFETKD